MSNLERLANNLHDLMINFRCHLSGCNNRAMSTVHTHLLAPGHVRYTVCSQPISWRPRFAALGMCPKNSSRSLPIPSGLPLTLTRNGAVAKMPEHWGPGELGSR